MEIKINASFLTSAIELIEDTGVNLNIKKSELKDYQLKGFDLLEQLKWTDKNQVFVKLINEENLLGLEAVGIRKEIITDYLLKEKPIYLDLLKSGREYFLKRLPEGFLQCLEEAKLFDEENISWWDYLQSHAFSKQDAKNLRTGREAESNSMNYERNRLKRSIDWVALENNTLGFDIHSYKSEGKDERLTIEVKGSNQKISNAEFYVTKKEWSHALDNCSQHEFHIWDLFSMKLAILLVRDLEKHIPRNYGRGTWESVRIPFSLFKNKFKLIKQKMK